MHETAVFVHTAGLVAVFEKPMRILFIHNNFPGQYRRIASILSKKKEYQLLSGSLAGNDQPAPIRRVEYKPHRKARPVRIDPIGEASPHRG